MKRSDSFALSVVVPAYNEAECVEAFVKELSPILESLAREWEIIFVDDGSADQTFQCVAELARRDPRIKGLGLSRNVGHQAALAAGLVAARGDVIVTMDADLQHPPSFVPKMLAEWQAGYDVVNTIRKRLETTSPLDALFSKCFYWLFNRVSNVQVVPDSPDFRLLDRACVDALNDMEEHLKFFRGMVPYIGFAQTTLTFDCPPRVAGERSYTFKKSLRLAATGLLSFSDFGLKLPFYVGIVALAIALAYIGVATVLVLQGTTPLVQGWASLMAVGLLTLGLNLTFVGMFGLYLGKIFVEVKRRPLYFVRRTVGIPPRARQRDPA